MDVHGKFCEGLHVLLRFLWWPMTIQQLWRCFSRKDMGFLHSRGPSLYSDCLRARLGGDSGSQVRESTARRRE